MPFTFAEFFAVMAKYNEAVEPMQIVLVVAALVALVRLSRPIAGYVVAALWAWMGIAYHLVFFTSINPAAWLFGGAFVVAAVHFAWHTWKGSLVFDAPRGASGLVGMLLVTYALVGYPLIGIVVGHAYPAVPTFGLPCPTTIFTLGLLAFARRPVPIGVHVVPLLWTVVGTSAAAMLGVLQDYGLAVAAIALVSLRAGRFLVTASARRRSRWAAGRVGARNA